MRQFLGVVAVLLILITAPMWLKGVSELSNALSESLQTAGIAQVQSQPSRPIQIDINHQFQSRQSYRVNFLYQDDENYVSIRGNQDRADINIETSGSTWQGIQRDIASFLRSIGISVQVQNK